MKNHKFAVLGLALAIISFSSYEVVSKTVIGAIHPYQLTFLRFLIGGLFLLPLAIKDLKKRQLKLTGRDYLALLMLGILNVAVSMNMIQVGYQFTNANISAIIISANPIIVALISSLILKESLNPKKIAGLLIGIGGVCVAFLGSQGVANDRFLYGVLLQVGGMIAFSFYTVLGKSTALKLGSSTMASLTDLFGALSVIPLLWVNHINPVNFSFSRIWIQMIYLCIINTGLAFFLYFKALEVIDTSLGAMSFFVKPLLACVIAALFLKEALTIQIFAGMVLVACGIYLVISSMKKKTPALSSRR